MNTSYVFQDVDSIRPGKRWRPQLDKGIAKAQLVVVFWCDHASRSEEVAKEWKAAIEQEKDLLPLLLDATPLPKELAEFQWIDFQALVGEKHRSDAAREETVVAHSERRYSASAPRRASSGFRWLLPFAATASLVGAVAVHWLVEPSDHPDPVHQGELPIKGPPELTAEKAVTGPKVTAPPAKTATKTPPPPAIPPDPVTKSPPAPPPHRDEPGLFTDLVSSPFVFALWVVVLIGALIWVVRFFRGSARSACGPAEVNATDILIAQEIEAELNRRLRAI